jgi:murein DD-endopeptidase MepM/ murein hydrolase activator NlpD
MDAANVPDVVVDQMISIFSGVIDFHHDIVPGDRFRIVYEAGFRDGAFVRNGRVVAIELINRNALHQALWYSVDHNADGAYYTFDGRSMKRPFLRSPVEFSRLSSGFGGREHPLHHHWAQHKGVDFAAPTGTKVFATGDGEIEFVGQQNGYGNIVILKHAGGYSTYYAHLSGFGGIKPGQRVSQGQLLGFVGQTGWATGPHLHYEFRFKDVPQNPLSITLMEAQTLTGRSRQQFVSYTAGMLSRINALRTYNVAALER